jgi:uncharacterized protein YndB with AHSA1/START domain
MKRAAVACASMAERGTYEHVGGRPALRFERRLDQPVEVAWRAVSEPAELVSWFPQAVEFDALEPAAGVAFTFPGEDAPAGTGRVVDVHPPHLLAFTWFGDILTIEIEPELLRFTHLLSDIPTAARTMAGWHVCLDRLDAHLAGERSSYTDAAHWRALYDDYVERGVPHGAPIPQ